MHFSHPLGTSRPVRLLAAAAAVTLLLGACGDDDDASGDAELSADQEALVDLVTSEEMQGDGLFFERECVAGLAGGVSDEDAAALVDSNLEPEAAGVEVSDEAMALGGTLMTCLDLEQLAGAMAEELGADEECLADVFGDVDLEELSDEDGELFDLIGGDIEKCMA